MALLIRMCRLIGEGTAPAEAARLARDGKGPGQPDDGARPRESARPGGHTLPTESGGAECQGLARAAMRLDAPTVESLLSRSLAARGVVATWEELAVPVLYGMGAKWSRSRRYVEVEHLLSYSISTGLRRVEAAPAADSARPVLLACVCDELHTLPLEALAAALAEAGRPYRMLGAAVPTDAVAAAVRRTAPAAVVLWSQTAAPAAPRALQPIREAHAPAGRREATTVFTAGPGWPQGRRLEHLASLREAAETLTAAD